MQTVVRIAVRIGLIVAALVAVIAEHNFLYALRKEPRFVLVHHEYLPNVYDLVLNLIQVLVIIGLVSIAAQTFRGTSGIHRKFTFAGVVILSGATYWISKGLANYMAYRHPPGAHTPLNVAYWSHHLEYANNHDLVSLAFMGALVATLGLVFAAALRSDVGGGINFRAFLVQAVSRLKFRRGPRDTSLLEASRA